MKKHIFLVGLLALGLTACVETEYVPVPVEVPAEDPINDEFDEVDRSDARVLYINEDGNPVYCYYDQEPLCPDY